MIANILTIQRIPAAGSSQPFTPRHTSKRFNTNNLATHVELESVKTSALVPSLRYVGLVRLARQLAQGRETW